MSLNKQDDICAGIVMFNPDMDRLRRNVESIKGQVSAIIFADNGSKNQAEIANYLDTLTVEHCLIQNDENRGIAVALNQIMAAADKRGMQWVLTLDHDSVCPSNLVATYRKFLATPNLGLLSPRINDRNFGPLTPADATGVESIKECITSGALTSTEAWKAVGGFDENLFIDGVDTEFCYRLRSRGFDVVRTNDIALLHEIGKKAQIITLCGHRFIVYNHAPFRYFYITRNLIYIAKKHKDYERPQFIKVPLIILIRFVLTWLYEKQKWAKTKAICRGIAAGIKMKAL